MTLVKVCGITHAEDIAMCAAAGVDRLGFVVEYPVDVPWNLTRAQAAELMRGVPDGIDAVAVVGGDAATIAAIIRATAPAIVQLHGDESPETVTAVADLDVRVIKALRVDPDAPAATSHWVALARRFVAAGADEILVDARTAIRPAGTGRRVDDSLASHLAAAIDAPLILAGGLSPENVAAAIGAVGPAGVDVISGVEDDSHRKVASQVAQFVAAVRASA